MEETVIAQKGPYEVEVEAGRTYSWCRCGRSAKQPWCDGAHGGTGIKPLTFQAEETETVYLCGCKHTKDDPFCDGSHEEL